MDFTLFFMCFLSWVFHRRTAPLFSLPFSARWGRDWRGKPCVPFSVCEGSETITKTSFSPLFTGAPRRFSPCRFRHGGEGVERETMCSFLCLRRFGNYNETSFSPLFAGAPRRFSPCRFRHGGEGIGKGNFVALSSVAEVWNPLRNGFQVFVTF